MKTENGESVVCPYCGYAHGDAWEWAADNVDGDRMECEECEKVLYSGRSMT